MKVFVIVCLFGLAVAAPQLAQQKLVKEEVIEVPNPYQFALQVSDDETTNYQQREESQDEFGVVTGEYSWVAPDGNRYITKYSATPEEGFRANTIKEPTDIKVIIPVPKPEFQRAV